MSVEPATDWPGCVGPPPVSKKMLLKLLKLNAKDAISSGDVATSTSGSVTRLKICAGPPPSTRAASVSSTGIACSAPIEMRKKYGTVSQKLTRMHDTFAQFA